MRKALIAVVVASALFAVGAFAASFAVDSENIASGSADVDGCADVALVDSAKLVIRPATSTPKSSLSALLVAESRTLSMS